MCGESVFGYKFQNLSIGAAMFFNVLILILFIEQWRMVKLSSINKGKH